MAVQVVAVHVTLVAGVVPKSTVVTPDSPVPVMVTTVPPPEGPDVGDTLVAAGADGDAATSMTNVRVVFSVGLEESTTVTAKVKLPAAVGEPEIVPLVDKERPAGRLPEVTDQV